MANPSHNLFCVFAVVSCVIIASHLEIFGIYHEVPEGHVGVYYESGALSNIITEPGRHFKIPYYTVFESVMINERTDKVTNISCATSDGITIEFNEIDVVNHLDKTLLIDAIRNRSLNYEK